MAPTPNRIIAAGLVALAGLFIFSACNLPGRKKPTETGAGAIYTAAAQTIDAQLTRAVQPHPTGLSLTPEPLPTQVTLVPTIQPSNTPPAPPPATTSASPAPTQVPCDAVRFEKDVTYPDNTQVAPGASFVKTWRLKNVGTCSWDSGYSLVFTGGDAMGAPDSFPLPPGTVAPGDTVDVSVSLTAPLAAGTYRGNWKMRNPSNVIFGVGGGAKPFWVQIQVTVGSGIVYDFVANAPQAAWKSGTGNTLDTTLAFNGADDDPNGVAKFKQDVLMENGLTSGKLLLSYPKRVDNGAIEGVFPPYLVQSGDRLRARLGFLANPDGKCGAGKVRFQIKYKVGDAETLSNEWVKPCNGSLLVANLDLSALKGKTVQFIFTVQAEGSSQDDWAIWSSPRIEH